MNATGLRKLLLVCAAGIVVGCGGMPKSQSGSDLQDSDYGAPPTDAEAVVREFLRSRLKDPYSAQVTLVAGPKHLWNKAGIFGPASYGWGICYEVNAKNSFGAYTGFKRQAIIWRDGRVLNDFGTMTDNFIDQAMANAACDKLR